MALFTGLKRLFASLSPKYAKIHGVFISDNSLLLHSLQFIIRHSSNSTTQIFQMLLELIAECPFIPKDAVKVKYNSKDVGKCVYIITAGGSIKRNVLGGFTAELTIQIAYQSFPQGNGQMINAQQ